jgi:hypothetical protein
MSYTSTADSRRGEEACADNAQKHTPKACPTEQGAPTGGRWGAQRHKRTGRGGRAGVGHTTHQQWPLEKRTWSCCGTFPRRPCPATTAGTQACTHARALARTATAFVHTCPPPSKAACTYPQVKLHLTLPHDHRLGGEGGAYCWCLCEYEGGGKGTRSVRTQRRATPHAGTMRELQGNSRTCAKQAQTKAQVSAQAQAQATVTHLHAVNESALREALNDAGLAHALVPHHDHLQPVGTRQSGGGDTTPTTPHSNPRCRSETRSKTVCVHNRAGYRRG